MEKKILGYGSALEGKKNSVKGEKINGIHKLDYLRADTSPP